MHLRQLDSYIGHLPIASVHMGTLQGFIDARKAQGIKSKSINLAITGGIAASPGPRSEAYVRT